jgi:hypothetical protein
MFALKTLFSSAALGTLLVLAGFTLPAYAEKLAETLGPVGPHEPIVTTVGNKRLIAFYEPGSGQCGLNVVVWNQADESADSAARFRVILDPRQAVHVDSPDNKSLNLRCGDSAKTLEVVDTHKVIAAGAAQ